MAFRSQTRQDPMAVRLHQDGARSKRESEAVSLRKQIREETAAKRRNNLVAREYLRREEEKKNIEIYTQKIYQSDPQSQLDATIGFQKLLSVEENPPIDEIIKSGVVRRLLEFLHQGNEQIQYMSLWSLTNIAAGKHDQVRYLVQEGAIPLIVRILQNSSSSKIRDQACWTLGNIAGDCHEFRDLVLEANALPIVLSLLNEDKISIKKTATWTMSNLCRGRPPPDPERVKSIIPDASRLIFSQDAGIEVDALWTLGFLSEGVDRNHSEIATPEVCKRLIYLLKSDQLRIVYPAVRTIGNIMSGSDNEIMERMIDLNVLDNLSLLFNHPKPGLRKEACWTMSNILAGTPLHIQKSIDAGLIPIIMNLLTDERKDIVKEAAWCIANAVSGSNMEQIYRFVQEYNVIPALCSFLETEREDKRLFEIVLDSIDRCLRAGSKHNLYVNPYAQLIAQNGGVHTMEELSQTLQDSKLAGRVNQILNKYYREGEVVDGSDFTRISSEWPANNTTGTYTSF